MRYNINVLESIARGKIQLKSVNQWCVEHYGFNAFGFYTENQRNQTDGNGRSYFMKRMEEQLFLNENTRDITKKFVDQIMNFKPAVKDLLHWIFQTPDGKKNNIFNPKWYKGMIVKCKFPIEITSEENRIVNFLSNPDLNNYLYQVYFRHYIMEYYSIMKDVTYDDTDIHDLPKGTSIYEALKKFYSSIWEKISNSVEVLIEDGNYSDSYINQDVITSTGKPIYCFPTGKAFANYLAGENVGEFNFPLEVDGHSYFDEMKDVRSNTYIWGDTDLNYCSTVIINYPELTKFLKDIYGASNNGTNTIISFRAYYDNPIKTVEFVTKESKTNDSIIMNIIPFPKTIKSSYMESKDGTIRSKEIEECNIKILVELCQYNDKQTKRLVTLPLGDRNSLIVGVIPLKLILVRNLRDDFETKRDVKIIS